VSLQSWQEQRELVLQEAQPIQLVLTVYTLLLLLVSVALTAILTGARVSSQYREIGLLKAIGLTPIQVSLVFVIEALALGAAGVVLGFVPGALLAPRMAATAAATLVGSPSVSADPLHMLVAAAVILPVIAGSAFASARRATRGSALQAILSGAATPRAGSRLGSLIWRAGWLPIAVAVGLKDLLAKGLRPAWLMGTIAVTGAALVVTLCVQAALGDRPVGEPSDVPDELLTLILALDAVLVLISLSALVALSILSIRERIRDFGILRTVGLTPNEVTLSVTGAHAAVALAASITAIPAGIGLYLALYAIASGDGASGAAVAPWWWLLSLALAITLVTAIATTLPARLATRVPASEAVRYE
jgi:ABC-type antimicrobial peptide transport system permease subunit